MKYAEKKESDDLDSHFPYEYIDVLLKSETNEMFLNMDTRYFDRKSVREKAILVGEKDLFDLYYDYDSQFEHGLWGAIRETSLLLCDNPAHKFHHSIDIEGLNKLKSVWSDCKAVMNKTIETIGSIIPLPSKVIKNE